MCLVRRTAGRVWGSQFAVLLPITNVTNMTPSYDRVGKDDAPREEATVKINFVVANVIVGVGKRPKDVPYYVRGSSGAGGYEGGCKK